MGHRSRWATVGPPRWSRTQPTALRPRSGSSTTRSPSARGCCRARGSAARSERNAAPRRLKGPTGRAIEHGGHIDLAERAKVLDPDRSTRSVVAHHRHSPRARLDGRRPLAVERGRARDAARRQPARAGEAPVAAAPTRSASPAIPNAAMPVSASPPVESRVRREIPLRGGFDRILHRRGSTWISTIGTSARPSHAWRVSTVSDPIDSSRPEATHTNPPISAPTTRALTSEASASRPQRRVTTALGTDRRSFQSVAASSDPPSSPWSAKTQPASGPPALSDSRPVPAMATTSAARVRSSVAWLMTMPVCAADASGR